MNTWYNACYHYQFFQRKANALILSPPHDNIILDPPLSLVPSKRFQTTGLCPRQVVWALVYMNNRFLVGGYDMLCRSTVEAALYDPWEVLVWECKFINTRRRNPHFA